MFPPTRKKEFGLVLNEFKQLAESKYETWKIQAENTETSDSSIDLTLPADPVPLGSRHPISLMRNNISEIFQRLGFAVAEGPEIEDDWHNFTALNLPEHHPARDMQDTFYIQQNPDWLLRTHTSNIQIREMEKRKTATPHYLSWSCIQERNHQRPFALFFSPDRRIIYDENVSFADLKQTLYYFVQEMYGTEIKIRFRPSYFPFTEPSAEMDINCQICHGKGCNVCKHSGWVEILGCGMVHPKVLENCNIDSAKYTGFAFGMGIERPAMLKYGINDIRLFSENDVRFLRQFTSAI